MDHTRCIYVVAWITFNTLSCQSYKLSFSRGFDVKLTRRCHAVSEYSLSQYTFKVEVCDDTYTKNCHISFVEETSDADVHVCYTEAVRKCDKEDIKKRQRSMGDVEFEVRETCIAVYDTGWQNQGMVQCDQIGRFIGLWATFQSLWQ